MAPDDPEAVEAALARLRDVHPDVVVLAQGLDGRPCRVPDALGFGGPSRRPDVPAGLAGIDGTDRATVMRAFDRARRTGVAGVACRLLDGRPVHLHFVDVRATHGVILIFVVPDDGTAEPPAPIEEPPPKVTWARIGLDATVVDLDPLASLFFGWPRRHILETPPLELMHPDDRPRALDNWTDVLTAPGEKRRYRVRHLLGDGTYRWSEVTNLNRLEDPAHGDVYSEIVDISEEMRVLDELAEREQLLRELTDALPVGVVQFDRDGRTVHENAQLAVIVGAPGLDGLFAAAVHEDRGMLRRALTAVGDGRVPPPVEVHLTSDRVCRVTFRPLVEGGVACVDDVTAAVGMRRELERRATFDDLTACFNRRAILGALDDAAAGAQGTGVVFVDLDRFKPVNDELGHAAGDELLAVVGARLRHAVRDVDLVGRIGGDEFLVVCPGVEALGDVEAIARRIAAALAEPLQIGEDDHLVRPRASIGAAWAPSGGEPSALVARADAAMFESKRQSRLDPNTPTKLTISPG